MEPIQICVASPQDAQAMLAIYAPYVERTAVSFELTPPSLEEFRSRIETTLRRFPWLAVRQGDRVIGYAYASPLHPRAAYAWSAEASIYLAPDCHGQGVGRRLYDELEKILAAQRVQSLNACIACPREEEDPHLTRASLLFHEKLGFRTWGHAERCAFKFDRWYDMVWMGKAIGTPLTPPTPFLPFPEIREKFTLL